MATQQEYKNWYERCSLKLGDISRNVAFAGIGLIWVFSKSAGDAPITASAIPPELVLPAVLLVASLGLDMLQYLYQTAETYGHFRWMKWKNIEELKHRDCWAIPSWILWGLKVGSVIGAYWFILSFLHSTLVG